MFIVLFLSTLLSLASLATGFDPPNSPGQLDLSYEFTENPITLHEPVVLLFKAHNGLQQRVTLELGINREQFFAFSLTLPGGHVIEGRAQRREGLSTQVGTVTLGAGQDYQQELLLDQWFDFDLTGRYFLTASLNAKIEVGDAGSPGSTTSHVELEIKPRNTNRLTRLCSELARQVATAGGGEVQQEALLRLSHVNDSIAVPYLAQVLSDHPMSYSLAISGLEKIGDEAAINVLLAALGNQYPDIVDAAQVALTRLQDRITNPSLRKTVKKAVQHSTPRART